MPASPATVPRQRVAAALQPRLSTGGSPKGVAAVAVIKLLSSLSIPMASPTKRATRIEAAETTAAIAEAAARGGTQATVPDGNAIADGATAHTRGAKASVSHAVEVSSFSSFAIGPAGPT